MRRVVIGAVLLLASQGARAELTHFYCFAPDPDSETVYVSTILPVGPVAERGKYGQEFVDHLKKAGRVKRDIAAYCVMRESANAIARSRAALPMETCTDCAGLSRFADVSWSRGGVSLPTQPITPVTHSELHDAPRAPSTDAPEAAAVDFGPWLVVLGNRETGKLLVVSGAPNLEKAAQAQARAIRATGWEPLESTRVPGFGAAVCVQVNETTEFFISHGHATVRDAVLAARRKAEPLAARLHAEIKVCGAPWQAHPPGAPAEAADPGVIDVTKGKVRKWITCDPTAGDGHGTPGPCRQSPGDAVGTRG